MFNRSTLLFACLYFLMMHCTQIVFAQDIRMVRDTVMVDDEPYAVFQSMGTVTKQTYAVKNLEGELLILIDQSQLRDAEGNALMRFMFTGYSEMKAFMPVSLQFRRRMMRSLVAYNLVQKNQLNEKGVELFCRNYPGYFETNRIQAIKEKNNDDSYVITSPEVKDTKSGTSTILVNNKEQVVSDTIIISTEPVAKPVETAVAVIEPPTPPVANGKESASEEPKINYSIVDRDIDQAIYLDGNVIRQDFEEIGLYTVEQIKPNEGNSYYVISIYDIRHDFVAEAFVFANSKTYEFKTYKDSKTRTTNVSEGDIYETVKSLSMVLSQLLYL